MALPTQHALNQVPWPAACLCELRIVIEFQSQQLDIGKSPCQLRAPGAKVRNVSQSTAAAVFVIVYFEAKAEGAGAIMTQRQRQAMQPRRWCEHLPGFILPHQILLAHFGEVRAVGG